MRNVPDHPCPVCGCIVFTEPPGSFDICTICFWEDDIVQLGFPLMGGGANHMCLHEAQKKFQRLGACDAAFLSHVHPAGESVQRDPLWRGFEPESDPFLRWDSPTDNERWRAAPSDICLYYWRPDYWLRRRLP